MTARHSVPTADGRTHASMVNPVVASSELLSATVTQSLVPSKLRAPPNFPAVTRVAPSIVPGLPRPEASTAVAPDVSSNPHAPTRFDPCGATARVTATVLGEPVAPAV